jgi:hypothetical protein
MVGIEATIIDNASPTSFWRGQVSKNLTTLDVAVEHFEDLEALE